MFRVATECWILIQNEPNARIAAICPILYSWNSIRNTSKAS